MPARIESGRVWMHQEDSDFQLETGDGNRTADKLVRFNTPFRTPPQVIVALAKLDVDKGYNTRLAVEPKNIGNASFEVDFKTWANTQVYGVEANGLAYGEE